MSEIKQSEVFERAIDVLHVYGWHQGALTGPDGAVCAVHALDLAQGGDATDAISRMYCHVGRVGVGLWNDAPERTVEDVLLALKQCAADARAEEMAS